jgi:hypothetical protein
MLATFSVQKFRALGSSSATAAVGARATYASQQFRDRPCGLMDKALVFGTKDCRFESCQGHVGDNGFGCKAGCFNASLPEWLRGWT